MIENVSRAWKLTRELDLGQLRREIERGGSILILGADRELAEQVAHLVEADDRSGEIEATTLRDWSSQARGRRGGVDVYVVALSGTLAAADRRVVTEISLSDAPVLVAQIGLAEQVMVVGLPEEHIVTLHPGPDYESENRDRLLKALVGLDPNVMLALGRRHAALRGPVAEHLIRDTARVNAEVAALSSLPAAIPFIGGMVGNVADIVVLTKNQILLLFKLAGLFGRDLRLGRLLLLEILPVVGGAFFWRSVARTLVGFLPPIISLVPKTGVAYSGTYVVGQTARYYYEHGRKPPPALVEQIRADGLRLARGLTRLRRP